MDKTIKIELDEKQIQALVQLMDLGVKNPVGGGLAMSAPAAVIMQKINEALQAASNGDAAPAISDAPEEPAAPDLPQ